MKQVVYESTMIGSFDGSLDGPKYDLVLESDRITQYGKILGSDIGI